MLFYLCNPFEISFSSQGGNESQKAARGRSDRLRKAERHAAVYELFTGLQVACDAACHHCSS